MRYSQLLTEKILQMDDDIDRLYDRFVKKSIELIHDLSDSSFKVMHRIRDNQPPEGRKLSDLIADGTITNEQVILANSIQPTTLHFFAYRGNAYRPYSEKFKERGSEIHIDYNIEAVKILDTYKAGHSSIEEVANSLFTGSQKINFINEFTPEKVKASINHEFAHFVDDILNNRHVTKKVEKDVNMKKYSLIDDPFDTYIEREGQIHNIHQLRRANLDKWDSMSFDDMIDMLPSFQTYYSLTGKAKERWKKEFKKRMHREGLLGKSMI